MGRRVGWSLPYQLGRSLGLIFKPRREKQKRNTKRPQRNKTTTCRFSGEVAPNPGGPMVVCPAWGPLEGVISWLLRRPIRGKSAPPSRPLGTSRDHPNTTAMRHVKVSDPHPLADLYDSVYRLSDSRVVHAAESWIHMSPISNKCYLNVVLHDIASAPHGGVFVSRHQGSSPSTYDSCAEGKWQACMSRSGSLTTATCLVVLAEGKGRSLSAELTIDRLGCMTASTKPLLTRIVPSAPLHRNETCSRPSYPPSPPWPRAPCPGLLPEWPWSRRRSMSRQSRGLSHRQGCLAPPHTHSYTSPLPVTESLRLAMQLAV
jgi:hypothetical protein